MEPCVVLKFGEMALKGRNRWRFTQKLRGNIRELMADLGPVDIHQRAGVLAIESPEDPQLLLERARDVIGISVVCPAYRLEKTEHAAVSAGVELLRNRPGKTFAVRARRRDKRFPLRSNELAALVGAAICDELGLTVDLTSPDLELHLEVDQDEILAYTEKQPGQGGLPVGISGRAVALLSGGIDSPVACYRMLRRGLSCDFVHFSGRPFTGPESIFKAYAHVRELSRFQPESRLFIVPFGHAQRQLASAGAGRLQVLAQRRLMVRVACELAGRHAAQAIVTGDSLGQVSSQTLENLAAVESAATLPLFRPLLDRDKSEIVAEARMLGTLEVSNLPDEDCCTLFASQQAVTKARPAALERLERRLDEDLIERLLDTAQKVVPAKQALAAEPEAEAGERQPAAT
jgi:thiamine biosynthesis protein ThiI